MSKKRIKPQPIMRIHVVNMSNGYGFSDTKVTIRTDGTKYEKRVTKNLDTYGSLETVVPELTAILKKYPDATLTEEPKRFEDGNDVVIEWWEPLSEDDPAVQQLLENAKRAEQAQRERDEREFQRLKAQRPDLFKK